MAFTYYAVRYGANIGIYDCLEDAKNQVRGWSGGEMKGFNDLEDAEDYLSDVQDPKMYYVVDDMIFDDDKEAETYSFHVRTYRGIRAARFAVLDNYHDYDERLREDSYFINADGSRTYQVFTDGACLFNGYPDAAAGCGVFFGLNNSDNMCFWYNDAPQTNQTAELKAIEHALKWIEENRGHMEYYQIFTDSDYAIKCVTLWYKKWQNNGWLNSKGLPVANEKIIKNIVHILYHKDPRPHVNFVKVKGHSDDFGNNEADRLAGIAAENNFDSNY